VIAINLKIELTHSDEAMAMQMNVKKQAASVLGPGGGPQSVSAACTHFGFAAETTAGACEQRPDDAHLRQSQSSSTR
jgi:hypothetical protein